MKDETQPEEAGGRTAVVVGIVNPPVIAVQRVVVVDVEVQRVSKLLSTLE